MTTAVTRPSARHEEAIVEQTRSSIDKSEIKALLIDKIPDFDLYNPEYQDSLIEYYISVNFLAEQKLNFEFNNKDDKHAAIVLSTIYKKSTAYIKVFCGNLKGDVCDKPMYLDSLTDAIEDRKIPIEIVFQDNPNTESKCFKLLDKNRRNGYKIKFYQLTKKYLKKVGDLGITLHHFAISDEQMLRYEFDGNEYKAYCNFDDRESVKTLLLNFDALKLNSTLPKLL